MLASPGSARAKWVALLVSTVLSVSVGALALHLLRPEEVALELVDDSAEIARRIEERQGEAGSPVPTSPGSTLVREAISEEDAIRLFPALKDKKANRHVYDPQTYFRLRGGQDYPVGFAEHPHRRVTNSLGLIDVDELGDPDLRVLVVGDSHTAGVCDPEDGFPARIEAALAEDLPGRSVEVLNAGVGYYSFYHYLGALEKYVPLGLDALLVVVYGGNDFLEAQKLAHWFARTQRPVPPPDYFDGLDRIGSFAERPTAHVGQALSQLLYFAEFPEEEVAAIGTATAALDEIERVCRDEGIELLVAYLPPAWDVCLPRYDPDHPALRDSLGLGERAVVGMNPTADALLAHLAGRDVESVDLREAFRAHDGEPYWHTDLHISVEGQALVADGVRVSLLELLADR